jgi:hypothetical protein
VPNSVMTCKASNVKAARTSLLEKEIEYSRDIQRCLEYCRSFEKYINCYIRPANGKNWDSLVTVVQSVWCTAE